MGNKKKLTAIWQSNDTYRCQQTWRQRLIWRRDDETDALLALLKNIDAAIAKPSTTLLKADKKTTIAKLMLGDKAYVIKRYDMKSIWHRLTSALRSSRAARNWHYAHLLLHYGFSTPQPIAMVEQRFGPFRQKAYYISLYIEGERARELLLSGALDENKKKKINKLITVLTQLFSHRLTHGDMKLTNFLFIDSEPWITDLDAMRQHRCHQRFLKAKARDIARFKKNWRDADTASQQFVAQALVAGEKELSLHGHRCGWKINLL